jgi:hypothetical protein
MLLKQRNSSAFLATFVLALSLLSAQPSEARGGGGHASHGPSAGSSHASSGGSSSSGSSGSHTSRTTNEHYFGGRGHYHRYPYNGYSDGQSMSPVSNQFDQYTLAQDAKRVALPSSAFVHEYHWASTTAPREFRAQQSVLGQ